MFEKVAIKNPGCQFCRYFIPQFSHNGKLTVDACFKNGRRVFKDVLNSNGKRAWRWIRCEYANEKNKNRLCPDFQIQSTLFKLQLKASALFRRAGEQYPPTFSGEIWWDA